MWSFGRLTFFRPFVFPIPCLHAPPDFLAQRLDLRAGGVAGVDQEIGVLLTHLCAAQGQPTAAGAIDQFPGLVANWVLERRTAGLAAQRLARLAAGGDSVHLGLDCRRLARTPPEPRRHDDRALGQFGMTVGVAQLRYSQGHQLARSQDHVAVDEDVLDLAAIGPAVHPDEAADRAGDRAEEFQAGDP